ncbi:helix-turn-helix domain-containing protein [Flavobacterium tegetincola]|uniref:helix-turn-helix domain-containing protein n=1 Tax=Flavobacterium tegetincola TaxID=150172 RepID=UPI0003FF9A67|nr:helix-turn-helix domain-containing protein [Flavobacterium tegetincola]
MIENKASMLVTLDVADLQNLIKDAIRNELENLKNLIQINPKDSENESNLLTREETAKLLKVSFTSLFHWANKNILKPKKLGRRVYYLKSEVYDKLNAVA